MTNEDVEYTILNVEEIPSTFPTGNPLADTLELWRSWAGDRKAPTWRDVEMYNIPPIVLPQTLVVDVINGGQDYKYRFWGSDYTAHYGMDETGMLLSKSIGPGFIEATRTQLQAVLDRQAPCTFDVAIRAPRSGIVQTKINLRLPIMDTPTEVTKVLTATLFNETTLSHRTRLLEAFCDDAKLTRSTSED
ncbi:MAG: hypothetical protein NWR87_03945 [Rhodospirillales bacterium]|nr:hypothetical protein [Rhodospirillales bacterium]